MDGKTPRTRKSFLRRLVRGLALLLIPAVALVAALPWLLGTAPARNAVVAAVNQGLAPSRVGIKGISASWFRPVRLTGLTLRNKNGKTLIAARQAVLGHGLVALAMNPRRLGTIVVEGAEVDIERRADGSIDLVDALSPPKPAVEPKPEPGRASTSGPALDVSLRVVRGSLRLKSPELAEPLVAGQLDMDVNLPAAADKVLSWRVRLKEPSGGPDSAAQTLGIDGTFDHHAATDPNLTLHVKGERWPLALAGASLGADARVRARLDGLVVLERKAGRFDASGDARLLDFDASGPALSGDRLRLDSVALAWDLAQTSASWNVRRLDLKSPLAEVSATGTVAGVGKAPSAKAEATVDLAALAKQLPHALRIREGLTLERGSAHLRIGLTTEGDTQRGEVEARLSDLVARDATHAFTLRDPATLSARATRTATGFGVQGLAVKSAFLNVDGSGDLDRGLTLTGGLDLGALQAQLRDLIDFGGVKLAGKGRMVADYRKTPKGTFLARYAAEVSGLKLVGLTAEPVERETARFDAAASGPIDASGLPNDWEALRVNLKSSQDAVTVAAGNKAGTVAVSASASLPMKVAERDAKIAAKVVGRWRPNAAGGVAELDELGLTLVPTDPALASAGTLSLATRGRLDLGADSLTLTPLPSPSGATAGAAVVLEPGGVFLVGLRATPVEKRVVKLSASGDLAALDRALVVWTASTANGLTGSYRVELGIGPDGKGGMGVGLSVVVPELTRPGPDGKSRTPEGPVSLTCVGTYRPGSDRFDVTDMKLGSRYGSLSASGSLDEPTGRRLADLQGTLKPNWALLTAMAAQSVEPNARLEGGTRPFRVKGPFAGGSLASTLKGLDAELGLDLASADLFGLRLGPAPLVVRCGGGAITVDPIETTLNGGRVNLKPGLDVDDTRGIALTLAPGSSIDGVSINDEVSRRVLRYVAPVLDKATHVNGRVSMNVEKADIPLSCPPGRQLALTGRLLFQDVVFAPGPFAGEVLALAGKTDSAGVKLHQPVQLSIADGRVLQKGLEIPVRKDATVALEGSVGFDETLDLKASVPITKGMLGQVAGLSEFVSDSRVTVPIGGTVKQPKINRQALQVALKALTKDVVKRGLSREASGLLDRIAPAPAPGPGESGNANGNTPAPVDPVKGLEDRLLRRLLPKPRGGAAPAPAPDTPQP
jgi:translocation and assembly module TamB